MTAMAKRRAVRTLSAPLTRLIDLENDDLRPVAEIAKERTGKRPPPGTVWRWRLNGCHGEKLEMVLCSGCWCTTTAAFADWIRRQTDAAQAACTAEGHEPSRTRA